MRIASVDRQVISVFIYQYSKNMSADEKNRLSADVEKQVDGNKALDMEVESPPQYEGTGPPPRYSNPLSRTGNISSQPKPTNAPSQSHAGSCGQPASVVQGVLGPAPTKEIQKSSRKFWLPPEQTANTPTNSTNYRWNVQGTTLSDFGNPFRKSKRK
jgi:hypothetical protein